MISVEDPDTPNRAGAVEREGSFLPSGSAVDATNPGPEGGDTGEPAQRPLRAALVEDIRAAGHGGSVSAGRVPSSQVNAAGQGVRGGAQ